MVFHMSLSDNRSPQVSSTLLGILADLGDAVVLIVSTRPVISKSPNPFTNPLVTVPSAQITIGITVTLMSRSFFNSQARSRYLTFFFAFFQFYSVVCFDSKIRNSWNPLFFVDYH